MEWMDLFEPHILNRGVMYYEDGCVSDLELKDDTICAEVEGSDFYQVCITLKGDEVQEMECDCPYAAQGYNCKHMAAVLFAYEGYLAEHEDEEQNIMDLAELNCNASENDKRQELDTLVSKIPEEDVRRVLADILESNESLKNRLQLIYDFQMNARQMAELKKEIKAIIYRYSGRGGFIDWQHAYDFCSDLRYFLHEKIPFLVEHGCCLQAFEITNLVFREVGNTDMDDSDGGTGMVAETCYDYWKEIVCKCTESDKTIIEKWFREHKETDFVIDYMEEYIDEFYERYFISEAEIRERMDTLDNIIENHNNQNDCGNIYSVRYGYQNVIMQRIDCMRRLRMSEEDIWQYRTLHRHFFCIRELEITEAIENGNTNQAIQILEESKMMDVGYPEKIKQYSRQLIALYRELNQKEKYKEELIFQLTQCEQTDLIYFNELKACMFSVEEWDKITDLVLAKSKNIYFICDVLCQEEKYEELMQEIEKNNSVHILDKYEKQLRKIYPERVIQGYLNYIMPEMDRVCDRKHYKYLVQYLKKIAKCKDGKAEAYKVAQLWRTQYKRRTALMDELRKAGF